MGRLGCSHEQMRNTTNKTPARQLAAQWNWAGSTNVRVQSQQLCVAA
jgi:hypothetical protein